MPPGLQNTHLCAIALPCPTAFGDDARSSGPFVSAHCSNSSEHADCSTNQAHSHSKQGSCCHQHFMLGKCWCWALLRLGCRVGSATRISTLDLVHSVSVKGVIWLLLAETPLWEAAPVSSASMTLIVTCNCLTCTGTGLAASQRKLRTASETAQLQQVSQTGCGISKRTLDFLRRETRKGEVNNCFAFANLALNLSDSRCFLISKQAIVLQQS